MRGLYWFNAAQMAKPDISVPKSHGKPLLDDRRVQPGEVLFNRNG